MAFGQQLVCEKDGVADTLKAMPYAGSLVGFFIFSFLADNYGRKMAIGLAWFCASIGALVLGVSLNTNSKDKP
jgi:OCT family organic cation transporter-like MFS transporter 4/5